MAHLHLVSIHPWADGNGRMSRSLPTLRSATYQPRQDVSSWVRFNLVAYHQQAQAARNRIDRSGRTWRLLTDYAGQGGLDERVVSALHDVAMTGRARRLRYEHAEGLSLQ
jgi:fido (protein-threonine AMPylation protein)